MKNSTAAVPGAGHCRIGIAASIILLGFTAQLHAEMPDNAKTDAMIKAGRAHAQKCVTCHGRSGMLRLSAKAAWSDQISGFVESRLLALKNGNRFDPVMSPIAVQLSQKEISLISLWYQSVSAPK